MGRRLCLAVTFCQQSLADKRIADGGCGDTVSDVIRQGHHQIAKQERIRNGALPLSLFPFQNVPDNYGRVHTLQRSVHPVQLQSHIRQHGHATEFGKVLIKLLRVAYFPVCIGNSLFHLSGDRLALRYGISVEIQKLPER